MTPTLTHEKVTPLTRLVGNLEQMQQFAEQVFSDPQYHGTVSGGLEQGYLTGLQDALTVARKLAKEEGKP